MTKKRNLAKLHLPASLVFFNVKNLRYFAVWLHAATLCESFVIRIVVDINKTRFSQAQTEKESKRTQQQGACVVVVAVGVVVVVHSLSSCLHCLLLEIDIVMKTERNLKN